MSFSLTATDVSDALSELPQFPAIQFSFSKDVRYGKQERPYSLLSASYSRNDHTPRYRNNVVRGPNWHLYVGVVPSDRRSALRERLRDEALPNLRLWLLKISRLNRFGTAYLMYEYDEGTDILLPVITESLDPS